MLTLALALGFVCAQEKEARRAHGEAIKIDREITHTRERIAHEVAREFWFAGKYRPRAEIFRRITLDRVWRGAVLTETATHFIATRGAAELRIKKTGGIE